MPTYTTEVLSPIDVKLIDEGLSKLRPDSEWKRTALMMLLAKIRNASKIHVYFEKV